MEFYSLSDIGLKRDKNQDSFCSIKNTAGDYLFLVCDGIGGGKAGEVASAETVKYFINSFKNLEKITKKDVAIDYLEETTFSANLEVQELSLKYKEFRGMGTTLTGLLMTEVGAFTINVGDSRVYGYKNKNLSLLTKDHTLMNDMIEKGEITYEESLNHPKRHYLMRAIGIWKDIEVDIKEVKVYDSYLICSDGLHSYVKEEDISAVLENRSCSTKDKTENLIKLALMQGGYDNITVIVVDKNNG